MSQNKCMSLWHQQLVHISNARIVRAAKLVNGIRSEWDDKEYNSAEVFLDLDNSDTSDCSDQEELPIQESLTQLLTKIAAEVALKTAAHQTRIKDFEDLNRLCRPYMRSKLTRKVRRNKGMTATTNKLKEVHADL